MYSVRSLPRSTERSQSMSSVRSQSMSSVRSQSMYSVRSLPRIAKHPLFIWYLMGVSAKVWCEIFAKNC